MVDASRAAADSANPVRSERKQRQRGLPGVRPTDDAKCETVLRVVCVWRGADAPSPAGDYGAPQPPVP